MLIALGILGWLVSAFITYGMAYADLEGRFPYNKSNRHFAFWYSLIFGLVGIFALFIATKGCKHGWRIR